MAEKDRYEGRNTLCVNVDKVYDWVIEESTGATSIPIGNFPITIPATATNIQVRVILTDESGEPVPLNIPLEVTEPSPREDHQFTIDGNLVTLQRVSFTKTLFAVLEVGGVDPDTGTQFLIASNPVEFTFFESVFLCAPAGTTLVVKISNFDYLTFVRRDAEDAITAFGLNIFICQSIQTIAPVTAELRANYCEPREQLSEQCGAPITPPDCSSVFPGN